MEAGFGIKRFFAMRRVIFGCLGGSWVCFVSIKA
jgi:hypothetical protein